MGIRRTPMQRSLLPLALTLAACDPVGTVGAVLVDPSGAPVEGAKVSFKCPPSSEVNGHETLSDASGTFTHQRIPSIPQTCTMIVEKAGFVTKELTMADVHHQSGMLSKDQTLPSVRLEPAPR
jgi:hypothetical protein